MKESLHGLLDLQQVDDEVDALHRHKSDYPARIAELKAQIAAMKGDRESKKQQLAEHQASRRRFTQQLEAAEEGVKKHQTRMPEIKTNREYEAFQQEMMTLHHAIDEYTEEKKKAADEVERLTTLLEQEEVEFEKNLDEYQGEIADLQGKIQTIDDEVATALERRRQVASSIPSRVAGIYERVRRGKKKAVVRVARDACSGCWTSLPPQRINELRMSKRVIVCDGCGRILVWDDRGEGNPSASK